MIIAEASASGKIILFGEHAVVYGVPAIAVPVTTLRTTVTVETAPQGRGLTIHIPDTHTSLAVSLSDTPDHKNSLFYTLHLTLQTLNITTPPDLTFTIESTIPVGAGLGSGAAVSAALARALSQALGTPLNNDDLNPIVYEVEKIHHGTPSGIDNTVIVYEQPIIYTKGQPIETFIPTVSFQLLVVDVGHRTPTHITVGEVRQLYEADPLRYTAIFEAIRHIVQDARYAINDADWPQLGSLMNENHRMLQQLTVSDEKTDHLCEVARQAGAYGAKLSGGGRGGNLIVLVSPDHQASVQQQLIKAGADRVFLTQVGN